MLKVLERIALNVIAMSLEQFDNLLTTTLRGSLKSIVIVAVSLESIAVVAALGVDIHFLVQEQHDNLLMAPP